MDTGFDASIGLAFSLSAFEMYRKNGLLQAELHHVPGIRGRCTGYLQLIEGKVVSCYIEDKDGHKHLTQLNRLIQLDNERGPFDWMLTLPPSPAATPRLEPSAPVPRIIALLEMEQLQGWPSTHKQILLQVYQSIDGQKSIEDIKQIIAISPYVVEEALHVLLMLKVVAFA